MEELLTMTEVAHLSEKDAKSLQRKIAAEAPGLGVTTAVIGNGEHICVVSRTVYIWSEQDWEKRKNDPDILAKRMIA